MLKLSPIFLFFLAALLPLCGCKMTSQIGNSTRAINDNSVAVKNSTGSISANRDAVDGSSQSISTNSLAVAQSTQAINENRDAVGLSSQAIGTNQLAVGQSTTAISSNTVAVNGSSEAIEANKTAVDQSTAAIKQNSQALADMLGLVNKLKENRPLAIAVITLAAALLIVPSLLALFTLRQVKKIVDSRFWPQKETVSADPSSSRKS